MTHLTLRLRFWKGLLVGGAMALGQSLTIAAFPALTLPSAAVALSQLPAEMAAPSPAAANVIPASSAITVMFPTDLTIDVGQKQTHPMTLLLGQDVLDASGAVLAPQQSPVSVRLEPVDKGLRIVAEALVIQGRAVSIQAASAIIPGSKVTLESGTARAQSQGSVLSGLFGSAFGAAQPRNPLASSQGAMIGQGVGILSGLSSEKRTHVVQIPQGSLHLLVLEEPVFLTF